MEFYPVNNSLKDPNYLRNNHLPNFSIHKLFIISYPEFKVLKPQKE